MNDSLDFFKMRRCVDDLNPDPKFPGCIYSEMKMCLAPCSVAFFHIDCGRISGPIQFGIQAVEHTKSQSMESRVQEALHAFRPAKTKSALETMEHLALLKRWYYRGSRAGEIFFADAKGELPMRRVVRGISRVFRGERPEPHIDGNHPSP
jgi:hypothetical protein